MSTLRSGPGAAALEVRSRPASAIRRASEPVQIRQVHHSLVHRAVRRVYWWSRRQWWRTRLASIGSNARIDWPSWVVGPESIALADGVEIWRYSRLEALNAARGTIRIEIGAGTAIQPFAHIAAVESVRIGRGCLFASHVYITDHDHEFSDPMDPVCSNGRVSASPVSIGDYAWLGERVMVLKGVSIGERSIIGAGSVVTSDVPPLCIAVGAPARVVRRWNETTGSWERTNQQ